MSAMFPFTCRSVPHVALMRAIRYLRSAPFSRRSWSLFDEHSIRWRRSSRPSFHRDLRPNPPSSRLRNLCRSNVPDDCRAFPGPMQPHWGYGPIQHTSIIPSPDIVLQHLARQWTRGLSCDARKKGSRRAICAPASRNKSNVFTVSCSSGEPRS